MKKAILLFFITINSFSQQELFEKTNQFICDSLKVVDEKEKLDLDRVNNIIKICTKHFISDFNSEIIKFRAYNNGDDSVFFDFYLYQISIDCELYRNFYLKDLNADFINSNFVYDLINDVNNNKIKLLFNKNHTQSLIDSKKELKKIKKKTLLHTTSTLSDTQTIYKNSFFIPLTMEEIFRIELTFNNEEPNFIKQFQIKNKSEIEIEYKLRREELEKYEGLPLPLPSDLKNIRN